MVTHEQYLARIKFDHKTGEAEKRPIHFHPGAVTRILGYMDFNIRPGFDYAAVPLDDHWLLIYGEDGQMFPHNENGHIHMTHDQLAAMLVYTEERSDELLQDARETLDMFNYKKRGGSRPGAGRPLDGDEPKSVKIQFRITQTQLDQLQECVGNDVNRNEWACEQFIDALESRIDDNHAFERMQRLFKK